MSAPSASLTPCPEKGIGVLGFDQPTAVPCGKLAGHDGPHVCHIEWTERPSELAPDHIVGYFYSGLGQGSYSASCMTCGDASGFDKAPEPPNAWGEAHMAKHPHQFKPGIPPSHCGWCGRGQLSPAHTERARS